MPMTLDNFINKYMGKATDYDGVYNAQCVDLIKLYLRDCFGIRAGTWGNAVDYYRYFKNKNWAGYERMNEAFEIIPNTPDFIPVKGDICVFGEYFSKNHNNGHIGIATDKCTVNKLYIYDQNAKGKNDPMKISTYGYTSKNFLGVLRPKYNINKVEYFPKVDYRFVSIQDALVVKGIDGSFAYRKKIAKVNGISGYIGSAKQNTKLLLLMKQGKLIKP